MIKKKTAAAPAVKKAAKPVSTSSAKPVSKTASKATTKPTAKPTAKPSKELSAGPAVTGHTAKPASRPSIQPPAKAGSKPKASPAAVSVKPAGSKTPAARSATAARADGVSAGSLLDAKDRLRKPKLIRDSFTMPEAEYAALGEVKKACLKAGYEVKKSELLRVGVGLIRKMDIVQLKDILATLPPLKAGRPKKS